MEYVPDWSERSYKTAPYPYAAPDAPEEFPADEWDADDWEDDVNGI